MSTFQTGDEVTQVIGGFLTEIMADPDLGPKFAAADAKVLMTCTAPEVRFMLDCTSSPPTIDFEPADASVADFKFQMSADDAHKFWLGKLNAPVAMAKRQIKVEGSVTKMLRLLPAIQPAYARYAEYLKTNGREDLIG